MKRELIKKSKQILSKAEDEGYVVEFSTDRSTITVAILHGRVKRGDNIYPCKTALSYNESDYPGRISYAEFTTIIHRGRDGENIGYHKEMVNNLNADLTGKLFRDFEDESHDVLYMTSTPAYHLTQEQFFAQIEHHAEVIASLKPHFDHTDIQFNLQPRKGVSEEEGYASNYQDSIRGAPFPTTRYLKGNGEEDT